MSTPSTSSALTSSPTLGITVFCGASPGNSPAFSLAARQVARALAKEGVECIYGGGTSGIMGLVRSETIEAKGRVRGIIPAAFLSAEAPDRKVEDQHEVETVVSSMHERKKMMADLSQAFIGLPGGFGTLEEVAEMTTWSQLGIHVKPVVLLNVNGFYSPLRDFIENAIQSGFIAEKNRNFLVFVDSPSSSSSPSQPFSGASLSSTSSSSAATTQPSPIPEADGGDEFDWGRAALSAIREWQKLGSGGAEAFSFEWKGERREAR
ncbi:hypothetical protein JCM8547_002965 [Rhodosporidiobolus lusitaniae]